MVYIVENMRWKEVRELAEHGALAVLATGSLEQHGPHLPTKVDTLLAGRVTAAAAAQCSDLDILLLPTLWLGASDHHTPFFAVSVTEGTYIAMLADLAASLSKGGVRRLAIVNGHGGNSSPIRVALTEIRRRSPAITTIAAEYWALAAGAIAELRETGSGGMAHAGELETSLVYHLSPGDVHTTTIEPAVPNAPHELLPDLIAGGAASSSAPWRRVSESGAIGDPTSASARAGSRFFDAVVDAVSAFLRMAASFDGSAPAD